MTMVNRSGGVMPYRARESSDRANSATAALSTSIWLAILRARISGVRMVPERVRFTGVCQPFASIRETYLLEDFASTV